MEFSKKCCWLVNILSKKTCKSIFYNRNMRLLQEKLLQMLVILDENLETCKTNQRSYQPTCIATRALAEIIEAKRLEQYRTNMDTPP